MEREEARRKRKQQTDTSVKESDINDNEVSHTYNSFYANVFSFIYFHQCLICTLYLKTWVVYTISGWNERNRQEAAWALGNAAEEGAAREAGRLGRIWCNSFWFLGKSCQKITTLGCQICFNTNSATLTKATTPKNCYTRTINEIPEFSYGSHSQSL